MTKYEWTDNTYSVTLPLVNFLYSLFIEGVDRFKVYEPFLGAIIFIPLYKKYIPDTQLYHFINKLIHFIPLDKDETTNILNSGYKHYK